MKEKKLVPRRRFEEFQNADAWEQRRLGGISNFITKGATPTTYGFNWEEEGIPFFRNDSIKDNRFVFGKYSYISEEANATLIRSEIHCNDILIAITGNIGKVGIVPKSIVKANINQHMAKVRIPKDAYPYFVYQYLSIDEMQKKYQKVKTGLTMPQLSLEQIRDTIVKLPSIEEQKKIGVFFKNLDTLITLHQHKLEKTKALKSAYLAEMFPAEGETVPKRRFEGFSGPWEQRKLGDIYNSVEGGNRLPKNMLSEGSIPYVIARTTENGILMRIDKNTRDYHGNKMKMYPSGSITFSIDNPEAVFLQKESFFASNIMRVLYMEEYNTNHSIFILESLKKLTKNYNWSLKFSGPVVMNSSISLPVNKQSKVDWNEIEKIGKVINSHDHLITLYHRNIDKLKAIKQAYLQEMLV